MQETEHKQLIQNAKESYYRIGAVPCPIFGGELVYFNNHGWNHLLRKGRFVRDAAEQRKRIDLIKYAEYIIKRSLTALEFKENVLNGNKACFWVIQRYVDSIRIRIVIRKLNGGKLHFFSIMGK